MCRNQLKPCGLVTARSCTGCREKLLSAVPKIMEMSELITAVKKGDVNYVYKVFSTLSEDGVAHVLNYQAPQSKETLLFCACVTGRYEMVRLLLHMMKGRGSGNLYTAWGAGPLHAAAERCHEAVVRLLLKYGVDVNAQTTYGDTPLHLAAYRGHYGVVKCLVEAGCSLDIRNSKNKTALDDAETARHLRIAQYLIAVMHPDMDVRSKTHQENKMANVPVDMMKTQPLVAARSTYQRLDRSLSWDCSSNNSIHGDYSCSNEEDSFGSVSKSTTNDVGMGRTGSLPRYVMSHAMDVIPEVSSGTLYSTRGEALTPARPPCAELKEERRVRHRSSSDSSKSRVDHLEKLVERLQHGLMATQEELGKTRCELRHANELLRSRRVSTEARPGCAGNNTALILNLHNRDVGKSY